MRAPLVVLAGSLLIACSSGTRIIYVPTPATTPAPAPAPVARAVPAPMPPVGVNIVRVDEHRLQVSTNQPAYLAVFEIVPYRGVTLVYPASPRQRQVALTGTSWLNVAWRSDRGANDDDAGDMRRERRRAMTHHIYAIASERPLRLTDGAYDDVALRGMLGVRVYLADDPYETMTALSRRFVPPQKDEDWGEDVYTMDVVRPAVVRVAKIYCPDGSVMYVRDEMAERAVCAYRGRSAGPDSAVASNGQRVARRMEPGPSRVFRVPANYGQNDGANNGNSGNGSQNGNNGANNENDGREKSNNGNHYGWDKNKNDGKDKGNNGNNGNNGNDDKSNNGNHYGQQKGDNGNNGNGNNGNSGNGNNGNKEDIKLQGRTEPQRPSQPTLPTAQPMPDPKPVAEPAHEQPKPRDEPKIQEQPKPQEQPKASDEPKAKPETRGMRGIMDRMREKAQADSAADAKDKKAKP